VTPDQLLARLGEIVRIALPLPGKGNTPARHRALFEIAREDLSLAKLAEAHWDAVAILAEAGREPAAGALYAVWASEVPRRAVDLKPVIGGYELHGNKPFCSGIGIVDRALLTAGSPVPQLVEVDLRAAEEQTKADLEVWRTDAFSATKTGSLDFLSPRVTEDALVGAPGWYLERPGFWHGSCGPAACWAGGVAGLLDFALRSRRRDPHTVAHLAALHANVWAMTSLLEHAGAEIDQDPEDRTAAHCRALTLRHSIEQLATDCLRRFARAYGPYPLAMDGEMARRYAEADLFLRQSHGERDLEALGKALLGIH
jgi:hypothetical protein